MTYYSVRATNHLTGKPYTDKPIYFRETGDAPPRGAFEVESVVRALLFLPDHLWDVTLTPVNSVLPSGASLKNADWQSWERFGSAYAIFLQEPI